MPFHAIFCCLKIDTSVGFDHFLLYCVYITQSMLMTYAEKILALTAQIPRGKITTYKELSIRAGSPRSYRACGNALNKNPHPITVPCHRVVKTNGELGGYALGASKKARLLRSEGINIKNNKIVDLQKNLWI